MSTNQSSSGFLASPQTQRYLSLDVLRGLTVALMIVVNTLGTWSLNYSQVVHAKWHGLTLTDMVFPSFLFVVGNAMSFSFGKLQNLRQDAFFAKVGKRALWIFLIGIFLAVFPFFRVIDGETVPYDFSRLRIMGVLQRIALCYLLASLIIYYGKKWWEWFFCVFVLLGYWLVMHLFGEGSDPYSLLGNFARKVDLVILGEDHLYRGEGVPFDPEGLLSTLPATVNVIAGYWVGSFIRLKGNGKKVIITLFATGAALILVGCFWHSYFPINKKIWTSSYVLVTVGISTVCLSVLMVLIEKLHIKRWTYFFEVFGKNPLILYVLSGVFVRIMSVIFISGVNLKTWSYQTFFMDVFPDKLSSLLYGVSYMLIIWLIGYWMDKKKVYIKV